MSNNNRNRAAQASGSSPTTTSTTSTTTTRKTNPAVVNTTPHSSAISQAGATNSTNTSHTSTEAHITKTSPSSSSSANATTAPLGSTPTGSTKGNHDVSPGALAGAIVASIILAALITFLVTWIIFRKRNKRNARNQRSPSHRSRDHRSPGRHGSPAVAAAGMKEKSSSNSDFSGFSWQAYLPQSADDKTVSRDVKTLFDQIELHVDNYYTKANVRIDSTMSRALAQFNDDNLPESIDALLANPQTTLATIKHCIAKMLIARMSPGYEQMSLLPEYLSAEPTKLNSAMPPGEQIAAHQAYSQWRLLNTYLHPHPEQDHSYQQRRDLAAQDISGQISAAFAPWQGLKENLEGLKHHERSLVMRASDVATLVMSQASAYEYHWNVSSRSLVVFPGFVKTTDERGRLLDQPQVLVQPVFARG